MDPSDTARAHEERTERAAHSEAERLATDYCARRAAGESVDSGEFLAQLATEEERAEFRELAHHAELAMRVAPPQPERERILSGRYRLEREIGAGGMGRVFSAYDQHLERRVAIKVLTLLDVGDPDREDLLLKESRVLAALQHPGIVSVHETGRDGELFYVVMDLIDGVSLSNVIERIASRLGRDQGDRRQGQPIRGGDVVEAAIDRPLGGGRESLVDAGSYSRTVARVVLEIARTIEAAHATNVIHRDIKPSNVMLIGGANPVVLDFGLAGSTDRVAGAITQGLYGTVAYLAPEQARSNKVGTDRRTDVYQLGLLLYEFLTLERAFGDGAIADVLERVKRGDFQLPRRVNSAVPKDLEAICLKAMEVAPGSRYQTVGALREDLEIFLNQDGIPAAVKTDLVRGMARRARVATRRHPLAASLLAIAVIALGVWKFGVKEVEKSVGVGVQVAIGPNGEVERLENGGRVQPGRQLAWEADVKGAPHVVYALAMRTLEGEPYVSPVLLKPVRDGKRLAQDVVGEHGLRLPEGKTMLICQRVEADFQREGLRLYFGEAADPGLTWWFAALEERARSDGTDLVPWSDARTMFLDMAEGSGTRGLPVPELDEAVLARLGAATRDLLDADEARLEDLGIEVRSLNYVVAPAEDAAH